VAWHLLRSLGLALCAVAGAFAAEAPKRILFIGNSYTGVNQLPVVFGEILKSAGAGTPIIKSSTPGGQTLLQHCTVQPKSLAAIDEGSWDVVVLQGHSQEAARAAVNPKIRADFLAGAQQLCARVRAKSPQARIYFYETWARHPDFWTAKDFNPEVGQNPKEMQARIRQGYAEAAKLCQATAVVPAGDAWELNDLTAPPLRLHQKDNSHPEFAGTYLNALVFYRVIYQPKDLQVAYHGKATEVEAARLLDLAARVPVATR
jgi:hypothetical protein